MTQHPPTPTLFPSTPLFRSLVPLRVLGGKPNPSPPPSFLPSVFTGPAASAAGKALSPVARSAEHTSELQSLTTLVSRPSLVHNLPSVPMQTMRGPALLEAAA